MLFNILIHKINCYKNKNLYHEVKDDLLQLEVYEKAEEELKKYGMNEGDVLEKLGKGLKKDHQDLFIYKLYKHTVEQFLKYAQEEKLEIFNYVFCKVEKEKSKQIYFLILNEYLKELLKIKFSLQSLILFDASYYLTHKEEIRMVVRKLFKKITYQLLNEDEVKEFFSIKNKKGHFTLMKAYWLKISKRENFGMEEIEQGLELLALSHCVLLCREIIIFILMDLFIILIKDTERDLMELRILPEAIDKLNLDKSLVQKLGLRIFY
jgi:hypothetical protein